MAEKAATIEVAAQKLSQLFNSPDPSPFAERDLDTEAAAFIVSWAKELAPCDRYRGLRQLKSPSWRATVKYPRHDRGHFKWRLNLRVFKTVGLQARRSPCQLRRTVPAWRAFAKDVHSDLVPAPDFDTFLSRQLGSMRLVRNPAKRPCLTNANRPCCSSPTGHLHRFQPRQQGLPLRDLEAARCPKGTWAMRAKPWKHQDT